MTIQEAIVARTSRRKYSPAPIPADQAEKLQALLAAYNAEGNVDMRLVLGNGDAWNGLRNSYGMFSGVTNYVGLIYNMKDPKALERLGYYGELWVLQATALGLGTCWVGGSFRRELCPFTLAEDEMVACAIAVGPVAAQLSGKEKLMRRITHRKTKSIADMTRADGPLPDWFERGMQAVQRAPSAVNKQPVLFTVADGKVTAAIPDDQSVGMALDFGIAKLHFELGVGQGSWDWGNQGAFHHEREGARR